MTSIKVAFLTEIIAPYRIPVLNYLSINPLIELQVIFLSETESRRAWRIPKEQINFRYQVLQGFVLTRRYQDGPIFLNPSIITTLLINKYDCLIVGGYNHPSYWIALAYSRINSIRCLLWSESTLKEKRSQNSIKENFKRFLVKQASGYIVPGTAQAEYLVNLGISSKSICIAPNSVDSSFFSKNTQKLKPQKEQIKQELGLKGPVLLYVGRLLDDKGIPELLCAFEQICQKYSSVNLVLVGDGPDKEKYANECRRQELKGVLFTGFLEQEALPKYYLIADIFIFPTRSDPWGLVLNEAMLAGLPIICSSAAGAVDDLVKPEENGFIHEPGDVTGIVKYICCLLQNKELREQMGERSSQIIANYTPEKMAQSFVKAIWSLY